MCSGSRSVWALMEEMAPFSRDDKRPLAASVQKRVEEILNGGRSSHGVLMQTKGAVPEKQELNPPACEDPDKPPFPDDDSNQILPVEQFFGNLDIVQDFPQRSPTTSAGVPKRSRRRQFLAMEDSEEEEGLSNTQ
uniref:Uncharacterized protein n=1 Tax=Oryzias melastigma TaxID=30732 RepID=A0A3B3CCK4_ORYME